MAEQTRHAVDATPPESQVGVHGTDHVTVEGTDVEETIAFYRDILGLPLVLRQPNLDRGELTHLFFDTGDGRLLTVFVSEERDSVDIDDPDPGQVHHLAFRIDGDRIPEITAALEDAGHPVSEYDRGAFHSLYTEDNNGLVIELVADKFDVPDDRRGEVLAHAHARRVEDGADFVRGEHLRAAIEELGIDAVEHDLGDAPAGRDA